MNRLAKKKVLWEDCGFICHGYLYLKLIGVILVLSFLNYQNTFMSEIDKIKLALERGVKALTLKPSLGLGTGKSKTRIKNGLTCEIQEGNWKFLADMPDSVGGNAQGP